MTAAPSTREAAGCAGRGSQPSHGLKQAPERRRFGSLWPQGADLGTGGQCAGQPAPPPPDPSVSASFLWAPLPGGCFSASGSCCASGNWWLLSLVHVLSGCCPAWMAAGAAFARRRHGYGVTFLLGGQRLRCRSRVQLQGLLKSLVVVLPGLRSASTPSEGGPGLGSAVAAVCSRRVPVQPPGSRALGTAPRPSSLQVLRAAACCGVGHFAREAACWQGILALWFSLRYH